MIVVLGRWLLPIGLLLTLTGYFGPWIDHPAAGLVITALDLGEYIKFLPPVRTGEITLWRPGFYAPLVAVGTTAALIAYRRDLHYGWWLRAPLLAITLVTALNLMPPAWTPSRLLEPEFRWQTGSLITMLLMLAFSPFLALLPRTLMATIITGLGAVAAFLPISGFLSILPTLSALYHQPQTPGWGLWVMLVGLTCYLSGVWLPAPRDKLPATILTSLPAPY